MQLISTVLADTIDKECIPNPNPDNPPICATTIKGFEGLFANVLGAILGLAGIVLFMMLILGGFKYISSGGDPKAAAGARQTMTHAIMGLILVASAYLILLLIEVFTGASLTNFRVVCPEGICNPIINP